LFSNNLPDAGTADADFIPFAFTPNANGSFGLDGSLLAALNGGSLPDGAYTLHVRSQDANGKWSAIASVAFTLDTTAPGLNIVDLIDGIAWIEGVDRLKGQVNSFDLGTTATYQFDAQASTPLALNSVGGFDLLLDLPDAVGSHTLSIRTTDVAGNFQTIEYRFLIADLQPAVDDDQWVAPNPPTSGGGGSGSGGGAASWLGAGGGGGGYQWGNGGFLPGGNDPWGDNHANPYPGGGGTGYGSDDLPSYLEKMAIILDQAVGAIGTGSATVHQKAALYNRLSVLMEVADMVDRGGFYDRMAAVMFGIFNEAENDPIVTVSDAQAEGYVLATDLVNGTDAVRVQVFQTALLAVVNQVLIDRGVVATTANRAEFEGMVSALLALGRTYASLNPTLASDTATTTTPDFLDSLWRAQQPLNPTTAKPTAEIHAELARGLVALSSLLVGVNNPIQALTFVNNLIQAATKAEGLESAIHDAKFLRELVEFGFEFAKVNPTATASTSNDEALSTFLNTLWMGGNTRLAEGGLSAFFEGLDTLDERVRVLDFADNLIDAAQLTQNLQGQAQNAKFLSYLVNLGSVYSTLEPFNTGTSVPQFFLNTLWQVGNLQQGADELDSFLMKVDSSPATLLKSEYNLLKVLKQVPAVQGNIYDQSYLYDMMDAVALHLNLQSTIDVGNHVSVGIFDDVFNATNRLDIQVAATNYQNFLAQALSPSGGLGPIVSPQLPPPLNFEEAWLTITDEPLINPTYTLSQKILITAPPDTNSLGIQRNIKTLSNFLKLIQDEENLYSLDKRNTKRMITRLRKVFYNTNGWNNTLIPGTGNVSIRYEQKEKNTGNNRIYYLPTVFGSSNRVNEQDLITYVIDSQSNQEVIPQLFLSQEIKLPDGTFIDMGHVLAALDARNHLSPVPVYLPPWAGLPGAGLRVENNVFNVTWIGDLGSIVAKVIFETMRHGGRQLSQGEVQEIIDAYADPQDLLGDIDGVVIGNLYANEIASSNGFRVSEILSQYYLDDPLSPRSQRFIHFAEIVGLTGWSASTKTFANEQSWLDQYQSQIAHSAAQYVAAATRDEDYIGGLVFNWDVAEFAGQQESAARILLKTFLNALKVML
jgi:hypothetical protein